MKFTYFTQNTAKTKNDKGTKVANKANSKVLTSLKPVNR